MKLTRLLFLATTASVSCSAPFGGFEVSLPASAPKPLVGRVLVYISRHNDSAPITQGDDGPSTAQIFGVDTPAGGLVPGGSVRIKGDDILGFPRPSLSALPTDSSAVFVQAQLLVYDTYARGDGETLVLPVSCVNPGGNDGSYGAPAGTKFSAVGSVRLEPGAVASLSLFHTVPVTPSPGCAGGGNADSDYIKTVHVTSKKLSAFWGRPIVLEACVLLPWGFHDHPEARYPLVVAHGHYSAQWDTGGSFSETPPAAGLAGYAKTEAEYAYDLFRNWTSPSGIFHGARMLVISINHANPFFDDSYAVDSVNVGPYGSAIKEELLPHVESLYRGIGEGWARGLYGGSTGGWESIGIQTLYPDDYNGAYAACPDPVTFTSYATVNIYDDDNAYIYGSDWKTTERPAQRDTYSGQTIGFGHPYGQTTATLREANYHELVLGTHSRSCGQWDIWEAVFGPKGADGFPERIWDKRSGVINHTTAAYWREHFDLKHIMQRDWETKGLGAKLAGKIHLFVGGSDTYFLTDAVMDMQDFLETTTNPFYNGSVTIGTHDGRGFEHCFNGYVTDPETGIETVLPNSITRLVYNQKFLPLMAQHFAATAPPGADTSSWRY